MSSRMSRGQLVAAWFVLVAGAMAVSVAAGAAPNLGTWALIIGLSIAVPVLVSLISRGAPPPTVAELLHSVDSKKAR